MAKAAIRSASVMVADLMKMLSHMRPHESNQEEEFIDEYILPLGGMKVDKGGNYYKWVGPTPHTICWASHLDTVHRTEGRQSVIKEKNKILLPPKSKSNCLGADDTAGVWLMREMILANKSGLYVFFRGEENGCIGSRFAVKAHAETFKTVKTIISLDRHSKESIITFQRGSRCCSDDFGKSLASAIGMSHKLDKGGLFTDSACFTETIGECTNLSVGYTGHHGSTEWVDADYILELADALLWMDDSKLQFSRKPGDHESRYSTTDYYGGCYGGNYRGHSTTFNRNETGFHRDDKYYKDHYCSGYWDETAKRWMSLTRDEWEVWSGRRKAHVSVPVNTPMEQAIIANFALFSRLMESWGFDLPMLHDCLSQLKLEEERATKEQEVDTKQFAEEDAKRLGLSADQSDQPDITGALPAPETKALPPPEAPDPVA